MGLFGERSVVFSPEYAVIFRLDGPTGASTSTPARAYQVLRSREEQNLVAKPFAFDFGEGVRGVDANQFRRAGFDDGRGEGDCGGLGVQGGGGSARISDGEDCSASYSG
jgi:hypothetical protein